MSKRGKHNEIFHRLKLVAGWHERLEQRVWGLGHDLTEQDEDMDDRVHGKVKFGPWEQLHSIQKDNDCLFYTVVD